MVRLATGHFRNRSVHPGNFGTGASSHRLVKADMRVQRYWWLFCTGAILVAGLTVSLVLPRGFAVIAYGDLIALAVFAAGATFFLRNTITSTGQTRAFWALMSLGFLMWTVNQAWWTWYEVALRRSVPDPFMGDIVLFLHSVPFMAAIALRPHRAQEQEKLYLSTLNSLMLLGWWVFLYTFIVFPDEYVSLNVAVYSRNYDRLYLLENVLLSVGVGFVAVKAEGSWRYIYGNLFGATFLYAIASELLNAAIARGTYYSGSAYDLLLLTAICWFVWVAIEGHRLNLEPLTRPQARGGWVALAPRMAMLAILSLPVLGMWALLFDSSAPRLRQFRLFACLITMLALGAFVFLKQYLLDHQLMKLLESTDRSYQDLQRLQNELVQKEKLASLGKLVAGAAHEINNPVTAILGYSELLSADASLPAEQVSMARKIGQQARRTRDLVSNLLSFAQQTPAEKARVDVGTLLQRALQMQVTRLDGSKIRAELQIAPSMPPLLGNANQLLQSFVQIIGNAIDAVDEVGGGTITVTANASEEKIVIEFADSGAGIREPQRVFDPFYTTKPVGKGTGLGLSAAYGVVQKHGGQITCRNQPQGHGAVFTISLPIMQAAATVASEAAHV